MFKPEKKRPVHKNTSSKRNLKLDFEEITTWLEMNSLDATEFEVAVIAEMSSMVANTDGATIILKDPKNLYTGNLKPTLERMRHLEHQGKAARPEHEGDSRCAVDVERAFPERKIEQAGLRVRERDPAHAEDEGRQRRGQGEDRPQRGAARKIRAHQQHGSGWPSTCA